ncbi:MAG: hypothetical protein HQK96_07530 [Nitrospirae bacterium]|nr:hypothetical protein [Nitrospirota bacterium]
MAISGKSTYLGKSSSMFNRKTFRLSVSMELKRLYLLHQNGHRDANEPKDDQNACRRKRNGQR